MESMKTAGVRRKEEEGYKNTREYKGTQRATDPRVPAKAICYNYATLTT